MAWVFSRRRRRGGRDAHETAWRGVQELEPRVLLSATVTDVFNSPAGSNPDLYGGAAAMTDQFAIVGAEAGSNLAMGQTGAAYTFRQNSNGDWFSMNSLVGRDSQAFDRFGAAVDVHDTYAIVGAPGHDSAGSDSGAAYVFMRGQGRWSQMARFTADDAQAGDRFGEAVAIFDRIALVGAPGRNSATGADTGAVYVFRRFNSGWQQMAVISPTDAQPNDQFGSAVSLYGMFAVIGAPTKNGGAAQSGAAYTFRRSGSSGANWIQQAMLTASDPSTNSWFGASVSTDGLRAVVGAEQAVTDQNGRSGAAYVYRRMNGSWSQESKLQASDGRAGDSFGKSVAVMDTTILVGATGNSLQGDNSGAAYVFTRQFKVWGQTDRVMVSQATRGDRLGSAVALDDDGDDALLGAEGDLNPLDLGVNLGRNYFAQM